MYFIHKAQLNQQIIVKFIKMWGNVAKSGEKCLSL